LRWLHLIDAKSLSVRREKYATKFIKLQFIAYGLKLKNMQNTVNINKKAVLSQGNRAMPQLFFSV